MENSPAPGIYGFVSEDWGCLDIDVNDIESWLEADNDEGYSTIAHEKIFASCASEDTKKWG